MRYACVRPSARVCVCEGPACPFRRAAPRSLILLAEGNAEETERISVS